MEEGRGERRGGGEGQEEGIKREGGGSVEKVSRMGPEDGKGTRREEGRRKGGGKRGR
jgi:hypothetical protein